MAFRRNLYGPSQRGRLEMISKGGVLGLLLPIVCLLGGLSATSYAQDASHKFIDQLIPKRQYSLSPSGNLLLVSEQTEGRFDRPLKLLVRPVTPKGLGTPHHLPILSFRQVWWSPRTDKDELIGEEKARWYTVEIRNAPHHITTAPLREVTFPKGFSEITIRRFPPRLEGRAIVSARDRTTAKPAIYGCDIYSRVDAQCELVGLYSDGVERYFFGHRDNLIARTRWSAVNPSLVDFQVFHSSATTLWQTSFSYDPTATVLRILSSPDKEGRVLVLSNRQSNRLVLARLNLADGREEVISKHKYDVDELFQNAYTREVLATSSSADIQRVDFLNRSLQRRLERLLRNTRRPLRIEVLSTDYLNRRFVVRIRNAQIGFATVFLNDKGHGKLLDRTRQPTHGGPHTTYVAPEPVVIRELEGPPLRGLLTIPSGSPRPFPFVIMIHGGPRSHYRWHIHPLVQRLASLGIAVLQLNYRGSSGYGRHYERHVLLNANPFESVGRDVEVAHKWLVSKGIGKAGRAGLWGESFGTTVAVQVAARKPDRYPVVALLGGLFDFSMYLEHAKDRAFGRQSVLRGWYRYLGVENTEGILRRTAEINPCRLAAGFRSSTLIFAALLDGRTHPDQSLAFHDELRARGLAPRLKLLMRDGYGHRLNSRSHIVGYMAETADFFHKKLVKDADSDRTGTGSALGSHGNSVRRCLAPRRSVREALEGG